MRRLERTTLFAGVVLAILIALSARTGGSAALARTPSPRADQDFRLATVDIYTAIERIMSKPDLKRAREDLASSWQAKAHAAESELQRFEDTLRALQKDSPTFNDTLKQAQARQAEYQKMGEQRQDELEKLNSAQLVDAYTQVRNATDAVAQKLGYSHVLASRSLTQPIEATTISSTLQQLLARPLVHGNPADDITAQVMTELKLDAPAPDTKPGQ